MPDLYTTTLKQAIHTLEGKVERLRESNVSLTREVISLRMQLQMATDMAEALKAKVSNLETLVDTLMKDDEPMLPMQVVVDNVPGRELARWN